MYSFHIYITYTIYIYIYVIGKIIKFWDSQSHLKIFDTFVEELIGVGLGKYWLQQHIEFF